MSPGDRTALEELNSRFDHTSAMARMLGMQNGLPADMQDAIRGIGETLNELSARMDAILHPPKSEAAQ